MLKVRDIMTTEVFTLKPQLPLDDAAWDLASRHIGGAPVVDDDGKLLGVLSKTDLADPDYVGAAPDANQTVADVMTPMVVALEGDAPAMRAAELMVADGYHRLLVVEQGKLIGIVTPHDLLRALVQGKLATDAQPGSPR